MPWPGAFSSIWDKCHHCVKQLGMHLCTVSGKSMHIVLLGGSLPLVSKAREVFLKVAQVVNLSRLETNNEFFPFGGRGMKELDSCLWMARKHLGCIECSRS